MKINNQKIIDSCKYLLDKKKRLFVTIDTRVVYNLDCLMSMLDKQGFTCRICGSDKILVVGKKKEDIK